MSNEIKNFSVTKLILLGFFCLFSIIRNIMYIIFVKLFDGLVKITEKALEYKRKPKLKSKNIKRVKKIKKPLLDEFKKTKNIEQIKKIKKALDKKVPKKEKIPEFNTKKKQEKDNDSYNKLDAKTQKALEDVEG